MRIRGWRALTLVVFAVLAMLASGVPVSAAAHENHVEEEVEAEPATGAANSTAGMGKAMADHHEAVRAADAARPWPARLLDWVGHMHPFAVHFPIALFPISWLALIIARRRGGAVDVIRALIIVAGVAAVGAAMLGWVNAGVVLGDRDPIQTAHRWIGTTLAVIGALLALWAWRRTSSMNGRGMVWALGFVTLLLLVQGWLGGALTHGMRHMMF